MGRGPDPSQQTKTTSSTTMSDASMLLLQQLAQLVSGGATSGALTEADVIAALGGIDPQLAQGASILETHGGYTARNDTLGIPSGFSPSTSITMNDALAKLYQLDDVGLAGLQARLVNAGLLEKGKFIPGVVDNTTVNAYKELLYTSVRAKARGQTMAEVLASMEKATAAVGGPDTGNRQQGQTISLTDPNYLSLAADKIAKTRLGHKASKEDVAAIVKAVHDAQTEAQSAAIKNSVAAANTKTGDAVSARVATITSPDPQAIAEQTLVARHATEAGAHDMGDAYLTMMQLIMGGAGGQG